MEPDRQGKGRVQAKVAAVAGKAARDVDPAVEKAGARAGAVDRARVRVLEKSPREGVRFEPVQGLRGKWIHQNTLAIVLRAKDSVGQLSSVR